MVTPGETMAAGNPWILTIWEMLMVASFTVFNGYEF
jgi:hypothetical protein